MPYYCVQLDVKNLLVEMDGIIDKHGFFTNQFVEAETSTAAEDRAVQIVQEDGDLHTLLKNGESDPPVIEIAEIVELQSFEGVNQSQGRVWYPMRTKRWWEFWKLS